MDPSPFRFAVSASFTAEPIEPVLAFWGRRLNSPFEVRFAPYNQLLQSLLHPASEFSVNHHGVNVMLARIEDLGDFTDTENGALHRLRANIQHLAGVVRDTSAHLSAPVIFVLCPPSRAFAADPVRESIAREAVQHLEASLDEVPGVQLLSADQIAQLYPVEQVRSPEGERLGRIPYTEMYFCALGTAVVRLAHALFAPPYKVIALDCDNTLWQGICGEDGSEGVVLDTPRLALQRFMAAQREEGMLLALASKNNEPDVIETFERHPEMPLALRHFVASRLNWDSKAANLAAIADELSIGVDTVIFVDDNPKECAEVEDGLPEVLSLTLPENAAAIPHFLEHVWAFDHPIVTEEDRNRSAYYAQSQEFGREFRRAASFDAFMRSLDLRVRIEWLTADRLPRVAQLTQRTNQFNFTTIRRSESEIQALIRDGGYECFTVDASDRFGDYGLVGMMLFRVANNSLDVDTLLLSCRALGRGVEYRMAAFLGITAAKRGAEIVHAQVDFTSKNMPARQFLHEIGASLEQRNGESASYRFPAHQLCAVEWTSSPPTAPPAPAKRRPPAVGRRFVAFAEIANTLSTPEQILEAMRQESVTARRAAGAGMTDTEEKLAVIWSDLLQVPAIAVTDNFFDLGGHSLLAVMLIMRVREAFGLELPIDDVYASTLTLGELARKIDMCQLGGLSSPDYGALLAEIESLSDEEVRRLLAEEDPGALQS